MSDLQIVFSLGQLIGTVGVLGIFVRNFKTEFERFRQEHYQQIERIKESLANDIKELQSYHAEKLETLQKEHYRLREELAAKYLRRDEWLSHHNKLEAQTMKKLEKIEELLREQRGGK